MNQNELKKFKSLAHAKYREKHGLFLVEGFHGVEELLKSKWETEAVVLTQEMIRNRKFRTLLGRIESGTKLHRVERRIIEQISTTETPQDIVAIARISGHTLRDIAECNRILVADGISDPGNLGTMTRSAAAFGFDGLVTTPTSADMFSPKVVRASQGTMFSLTLAAHVGHDELITTLKQSHKILALDPRAAKSIRAVKTHPRAALIVGAEIAGVSQDLLAAADEVVHVPMNGPVESLNAAVASGIAMYEFSRS